MVSIANNDLELDQECFKDFFEKKDLELIGISYLLMPFIENYGDLCIGKMKLLKKILISYFTECSKRKINYLEKYGKDSSLTKVYKSLWDYCIKHNIKPRSTRDGIFYIEENEFEITNEEKRLLNSLKNSNLVHGKIQELIEVLKRMIESPRTIYKDLQIYLSNLVKYYFKMQVAIDNSDDNTRISILSKNNNAIIKDFFEVFCKENGLNITLVPDLNPQINITSSISKQLNVILGIATLEVVPLSNETKIKVIKTLMETLTVEFKKSKYITNFKSFHFLRSNNHCLQIDKCIEDIKDNFRITIHKDEDWSVRVIKT